MKLTATPSLKRKTPLLETGILRLYFLLRLLKYLFLLCLGSGLCLA